MARRKIRDLRIKKRFLIPLWVTQLLAILILAAAVAFILIGLNDPSVKEAWGDKPGFEKEKDKEQGIAIYLAATEVVTFIILLVEIILYSCHKLRIGAFLGLAIARFLLNVPVWIVDIIRANADGLSSTVAAISMVIVVLIISYFLSVLYALILFIWQRRNRRQASASGTDDLSFEFGIHDTQKYTRLSSDHNRLDPGANTHPRLSQQSGYSGYSSDPQSTAYDPLSSTASSHPSSHPQSGWSGPSPYTRFSRPAAYEPMRYAELPVNSAGHMNRHEAESHEIHEVDSQEIMKIDHPSNSPDYGSVEAKPSRHYQPYNAGQNG